MLLVRKRIFLLSAIYVWLAIFATIAYGQYQIETWTTDNGLPQNSIYSILQTPDGYLWMTTLDGLARFDGVRFTVFNKNNRKGIESNRLTNMVLDGRGDLWIGAEGDFITRYHQGNFQTYTLKKGEQSNLINRLFLNSDREVLLATDQGIFEWNGESFTAYTPIAGENSNDTLLWGKDGTLWYAGGQSVFHAKDKQVNEYRLPVVKENPIFSRLLADSRGRIWIGTQNLGLFFLENGKINKFSFKEAIKDIGPNTEDRDGNIWAGATVIAPDGTVNRITTAQGLSEDLVTTVFQDREGSIWIGTMHQGVNRLSRQSVSFYSTVNGITTNGVYPIFQDRTGDIWIGGDGLTKYHDGKFQAVAGREKFPKPVTAMSQDRSGRIWFGHWGGVYYLENNQFKNFTDKFGRFAAVYSIHEDKNGAMWFATANGLFRYQNDAMTHFTVSDGLAGNDVKIILESRDGTLWVGAYGGLTRIKNNALTSFTKAEGLASNFVRSLYEDSDGVLWIGSYDGGLTRLKDGNFTRYTTNNGLFNDGVFQILEDGRGNLWMSSNRGIYRVAKQQLNDFADGKITRIESVAYSKADGLLETECNGGQQPAGIKTSDRQLWFPTQGGIAVIKPDSIKTNPIAPPVVIESAKIDNQDVAANNTIKVAPGKNNLEISYTALSFIKPEFVKFRYKLEGLNDDWVEAGDRRTASYSYLPPGNYTFHVIAANSDGVWNTQGDKISVVVNPPFYRTWWFITLSGLSIFGIFFIGYRFRLKQIQKKYREQEAFSRKLIDSQEQERKRIAAELHDSLGQSLVVIKNRARLGLKESNNIEVTTNHLDGISDAASHALDEVKEIAFNLRPYLLDKLGLTKTIKSMLGKVFGSAEMNLTTEIDDVDGIFSKESEILFYRIVQESVSNIIKHAGASDVDVSVKRDRKTLFLRIQDNGRGFDLSEQETSASRSFGLIGIAERARLLGGKHSIVSNAGQGTIIKVEIDLQDERQ